VTQRHPDKHEGLKYDLPGGAVIAGESIIEGAVRELFEEVGIYAEPSRLIPLGSTINGRVYAVSYLLQLDTLPKITMQPSEVVGYKLVSRDEFEQMTDSLTRGTKRRYLVYKNQVFD
jgi:ADP-ribose pyrophosphatase YjhB (NUDIX family)